MESTQTREARSWLAEGISTGSVQSDTVYDVFDSYADSHGPGSTGGRTHGIGWDQQSSANAKPPSTPPSKETAQQYAARSMEHAQKLQDAAEAQHVASPDSVMVAHKTTPASFAKTRQQQKTPPASETQTQDALASAEEQQKQQEQVQTHTTHTIGGQPRAAQPVAVKTDTAIATAIPAIENALSTGTPLVPERTGLMGACVVVLDDAQSVGADCDIEDTVEDGPDAAEPAWLQEAWSTLHDKNMVAMVPQPPAEPQIAVPPSGQGAYAVKQRKKQRRKAAITIAAMARARAARLRLKNLRQAATAISAIHRSIALRRALGYQHQAATVIAAAYRGQATRGQLAAQLAASLTCLLYTSPSPRDGLLSRMPSSA